MAFEEVTARLVADPVLACPDFSRTFILQTDASDYDIGAILTQETEMGEKGISFRRGH